jgi:hypothetical protein
VIDAQVPVPAAGQAAAVPPTRRSSRGKKGAAEDSLHVFVEQAGDMLEPGTAPNSGRDERASAQRGADRQ